MKTFDRFANFTVLFMGLFLPASFMIVAGCQTIATPATFNQKLAVAYSTVTEIRSAATTLLDSQRITADDGQNILDQTNAARAGLDVSRKLSTTDLKSADGKLNAIRTALDALKEYLDARNRSAN